MSYVYVLKKRVWNCPDEVIQSYCEYVGIYESENEADYLANRDDLEIEKVELNTYVKGGF